MQESVLKNLATIASFLDKKGLTKEANLVDSLLKTTSEFKNIESSEERFLTKLAGDLKQIEEEAEEQASQEESDLPSNEGATSSISSYSNIKSELTKIANSLDGQNEQLAIEAADQIDLILSDLSRRVGLTASLLDSAKTIEKIDIKLAKKVRKLAKEAMKTPEDHLAVINDIKESLTQK